MPKRVVSDISKGSEDVAVIKEEKEPKRKSSRATKPVDYDESKVAPIKEEPEKAKKKDLPSSAVCGTKDKVPLESADVYEGTRPMPKRNQKNELVFEDYPHFRPNLTPKEVLQMGSFGGTYFRPITSKVTGESYKDVWKELPADWLEGLDIKTQIASKTYDKSLNRYKETCGGDLEMWESSGWISNIDPYGWFMWYTRLANLNL
jgi:hypothetical protein